MASTKRAAKPTSTTRRLRERDNADVRRVTLWLPVDVLRALRHAAADGDTTVSGAIEQLARDHLRRYLESK